MSTPRNILIVTADTLGTRMAGPAIRAFEMAKVLAATCNVRLVSTARSTLEHPGLSIALVDEDGLRQQEAWADVVIFQGHLLSSHPWMKDSEKILVADIYDPMHLEILEQHKSLDEVDRWEKSLSTISVLNEQIARADFMVCASEKQRDFWLGQLGGVGRINQDNYDADPSLRALLDVAPFGLSRTAPVQREHAIRGAVPGIGTDDKVIIWGGGIYNWFDPLTLIRAVHALSARRPNVRLFFLGVKHPNPHVPTMQMAFQARELALELGLLDSVVFFNQDWVAYDRRADYLLDADIGVSTHLDHVETQFSFRTRMLDYLWASLPIVGTAGDTFAELIREHGLGTVVPANDPDALEHALEELLFDADKHAITKARIVDFATRMTWDQVLKPLIAFCADPHRAPDIARGRILASEADAEALARRVAGLEASTSWKVTVPLRAVTGLLRKGTETDRG